jgi:signal transduction histidine kinase
MEVSSGSTTSVITHVVNTLHSRLVIYAIFTLVPIVIIIVGEQLALPAFVFEHLMVILVVAAAVAGGPGPAVASAVSGGLGDNLLLAEPIGAITGVQDAVDLALFLLVAVVVGWLVNGLRTARANAAKAARREQEAREELDRLVATVTHDLATPLTAIRGTIQFARKNAAITEVDTVRLLSRIETAAVRATSLVRALADTKSIVRQSLSLELRAIDVRDVVEPIATMLDRISDRHPIGLAMHPSPLVVNGDAERLGRVVENLITNAIKYSPAGGAIEVQLREDEGNVVLTVRDYGIGISAEARDRLFEMGYRAPQAANVAPGLGLGLYTAAEIVRRHGGSISLSAPDGGGTMFIVRLPLAADSRSAASISGRLQDLPVRASRAVH